MDIFTQITIIARAPLYPVVAFNALLGVVGLGKVPGTRQMQEHLPFHQTRGGTQSRSLRTTEHTEECMSSVKVGKVVVSGQFSSLAPQHTAGSVVERNCRFSAVLHRRLNSDPVYAPNLASSHAPMSGSSIAPKSGSDLTQPEQTSKYGSNTSAHVALQVVGSPSGQSAASTQHAEFISSV